jgi:hypothetical protein
LSIFLASGFSCSQALSTPAHLPVTQTVGRSYKVHMEEDTPKLVRFPAISLSAEYLVMGYLLRRNILTYKAPPGNEGYDLICIHPDPRKEKDAGQIRVQVKSRLASDSDGSFPVKARTIDAFDYLIVVFLNVGYFLQKARTHETREGKSDPVFYTFPVDFVRKYHDATSTWEKLRTKSLDIARYKNDDGFELIANELSISYPSKKSA